MPVRPPSLCAQPGCPKLVTTGKCQEHKTQGMRYRDSKRGSGYQRGWTSEWAAFRKKYLTEHPLCECPECEALPVWRRDIATEIDHIDGTGRNGPRAYDPTNLMAMSKRHHSQKTYRENGSFGRKNP